MPKNKSESLQQARVLGGFALDNVEYHSNDVIEAHPTIIQSLGNSVDADPAAIKYCLGLENPVIKRHEWTPPISHQSEEQTDTSN